MSEYIGYSFDKVLKLSVFEFWLLLRDAVIYRHNQTEEGRKYLHECWMYEQTEPDRDRLREIFNKH